MTTEDNFKDLCNLTTSVLGLPKGSLGEKTRKQDIQIARTIASVIAFTTTKKCTGVIMLLGKNTGMYSIKFTQLIRTLAVPR